MPKVLILCEYGSLNGGERSLLAVLDAVQTAGFEIAFGAPAAGPLADALAERRLPLFALDLHDAFGRRGPLEDCRRTIRELIEVSRADLLHANSLSMSRLCGPVASECQRPSLGHLRDLIGVNAATVAALNCHSRLLAVSEATRNWYVRAGVSAGRVHVLYNGVDLAEFQPRPATGYLHRELGLPDGAPLVGGIGQIGMRKGWHCLAQAAAAVVAQVPATHFAIVGQRHSQKQEALDYEAELQRLTAQPSLAGHFHFLGLRADVSRVLNEFTLLVHPARQEPLGRVLLESAAAGTPVVATAVGGTPEIFPDDTLASLVPPDDPPALAAALVALLTTPARRQSLSRAARRRAAAVFDARLAGQGLVAHYRAVLAE